MRIAILGAGNVGGALAAAAVAAGHEVTISAPTREHADAAAKNAGAAARSAASNPEAVQDAELVVLAVPGAALPGLAAELGEALRGAVVVDSTNPLNDTGTDLTTTGRSAAEELQANLSGAKVVKGFNTIFASRHANPTEDSVPLDAFLASDDATAKAMAAEFAASLGYRIIDAGGLRMARALEEMAFLNIALNAANGWPWQSGWKLVGPTGNDR